MALFWRLWGAVALVNFAVLIFFVGLATIQFDEIHSQLLRERLTVLVDRTAAPFEAVAQLGLPIASVRNARALLERARQTDETITAVHVFDASGRVIHSTVKDPPAAISSEAISSRRTAPGTSWHLQTETAFLSGIDIAGKNETTAGGVLVVYPSEGNTTRVRAMAVELALSAIGVLLAAAALGAGLLRLGLARQIQLFESIEAAIARSERYFWRSSAGATMDEPAGEARELHDLMEAADARYQAIGRNIAGVADGGGR